ncbi:MAG: hypothetical protein FWH29_03620 [Methanobrevibacter sp.]|nr:hypothetical protein [Methanobrevibacter sp.]
MASVLIDMRIYDKSSEIYHRFHQEFENEKFVDLNSVLLELTELDNAIDFIDKYPKSNSNWKDLYMMKAERYSRMGDFEKTIEVCDEILKEDPYDWNGNTKKTYALIQLERDEELEKILEFRIKNNIRKYWALVDKAQGIIANGNIEKGMELIDEVLEVKPNMAYALMIKGLNLYRTGGNLEEVLKYLDKSLEAEDERCYGSALIIKETIIEESENNEKRRIFDKLF